jgi:S-adenosylmethionine hydrolase
LRKCTQSPVNTVVCVIASSIFLAEACGKGAIVLVHIIADYGTGDLAFAEVVQRIKAHLSDAEPVLLSVHPFSTLAAGFCIAQLGLNAAPPGTLIYHNVAPREDDQAARPGNAGERLTYARLPTGVRVIGVNSGYALSFIKDVAEKLRWAASPAEGSQFRSRDLFPQAAAAIALGLPSALGDEIDARALPTLPFSVIAYVDGYGNLKTTIAYNAKKVRPGKRIRVRVNDHEHEATVSDGAFAVRHGELAFAPGSSGWPMRHGANVRWMEIFLRGGNAWCLFKKPAIGSTVSIA